jgi:hypothetical protein
MTSFAISDPPQKCHDSSCHDTAYPHHPQTLPLFILQRHRVGMTILDSLGPADDAHFTQVVVDVYAAPGLVAS